MCGVVWCVVQCVIFAERIIPLKYKFSKATEQIYKQMCSFKMRWLGLIFIAIYK